MSTKLHFLLLAIFLTAALPSQADDAPAGSPAATSGSADQQAKWAADVKAKYNLTDAQMKSMTDAGLHGPELAMTAAYAQKSGQPLDKIIQMRTSEKMGWGKIAKTLGVPPSTGGQAVADLHRNEHATANREAMEERKKERNERKEERDDARHENHGKGNPHNH